jgi:hypothetical protein
MDVLIKSAEEGRFYHHCPGCNRLHSISVRDDQWDGDMEQPTMSPVFHHSGFNGQLCRYYITGGRLQYVDGTTHGLAHQCPEMKPVPQLSVVA